MSANFKLEALRLQIRRLETHCFAGDKRILPFAVVGLPLGAFHEFCASADTILWFDLPRRVAFPRVLKRMALGYGRPRAAPSTSTGRSSNGRGPSGAPMRQNTGRPWQSTPAMPL